MTSGVLALSAASRSWFSATEPPTSAPCGQACSRSRSMVAPTALSDGSCFGTTWTMTVPARPGIGGHHLGDARVGLGGRGDPHGVGLRGDDLQRAGRAFAEGFLHLGVGGAGAVALGHDLDRRHAGLQAEDGDAQRDEEHDGHGAVGDGAAPEALGPGGEARRAVLTRVHPRQRELVHPRAELGQDGRQQGERRREDEDDREHDAERHRPERGRRHEHHRRERDEHGQRR